MAQEKTFVATLAYSAKNENELSLGVGDVVHVLDQSPEHSGWWYGHAAADAELAGWFPAVNLRRSFDATPPSDDDDDENVRAMRPGDLDFAPAPRARLRSPSSPLPLPLRPLGLAARGLQRTLSAPNALAATAPRSRHVSPSSSTLLRAATSRGAIKRASVASRAYSAETPHEVSLRAGERIEVLDRDASNLWCFVALVGGGGEGGWVPADCCAGAIAASDGGSEPATATSPRVRAAPARRDATARSAPAPA